MERLNGFCVEIRAGHEFAIDGYFASDGASTLDERFHDNLAFGQRADFLHAGDAVLPALGFGGPIRFQTG